jgi:hypothetical protein
VAFILVIVRIASGRVTQKACLYAPIPISSLEGSGGVFPRKPAGFFLFDPDTREWAAPQFSASQIGQRPQQH